MMDVKKDYNLIGLLDDLETAIRKLKHHFMEADKITPDLVNDANNIKTNLSGVDSALEPETGVNQKDVEQKPLSEVTAKDDKDGVISEKTQIKENKQDDLPVVSVNLPKNSTACCIPGSMLSSMPNINDDNWPEAIDSDMIVSEDDPTEQNFRSLQIVNHINVPTDGKKILDFGCGNGFTAKEYATSSREVIGYDIEVHDMWQHCKEENLILTTNYDEVVKNGPYDLIILFDVLDHIVGEDPNTIMRMVASLLDEKGVVFVRTHPWTSRTGSHAYKTHNKAYLHLLLTPDEMAQNNITSEPNIKLVRPMAVYETWFSKNNLQIIDKKSKASHIESYFNSELMERIIKINWGGKIDADTAKKIMANHFIDYKLSHKTIDE